MSHGFNMDGRAASQTITDKIPYFLDAQIQLTVFSAITGTKDQRFPHKQYLAWGPAAFRFDFRHWVANRYGRGAVYKIFTPLVSILLAPFIALEKLLLGYSSQWSWAFPAFIHGLCLIRAKQVGLLYSTGGAWSAHLAALWLKKATGIYWIAEIHDPLVIRSGPDDLGFEIPRQRDARFRQYLEGQICRYADVVWWFTDGALHYAKVRNENLGSKPNAQALTVLPGAEPPMNASPDNQHEYGPYLNLCHFGSLANDRSLSTILEVLVYLFVKYPEAKNRLRIHAYGAALDPLTRESIAKFKYETILTAHGRIERDPQTGKSGREQIVEKMQQADVLILLHGDSEWCAEYIPSKFYEYLWTGRPIWGITHRNPQLDRMIEERGAYLSQEGDPISIQNALEKIWLDWHAKNLIQPKWMPIGVEQAAQKILQFTHCQKNEEKT